MYRSGRFRENAGVSALASTSRLGRGEGVRGMGHEEREVAGGIRRMASTMGHQSPRCSRSTDFQAFTLVFHDIAVEFATSRNSFSQHFGTNPVQASVCRYNIPPFSKARSLLTN